MTSDAERYPLLHTPDRWEWAGPTMTFSTELPPDELVASTHVVGFVGDSVVLCRDADRTVWFFPGGTREPEESVAESLVRELWEEAGARLVGDFHPIGAHVGISDHVHPYRPHLPHPRKAWLWGWAEVEVVAPPLNQPDGEQVAEVRAFPVDQAKKRATTDYGWGGELIQLAIDGRRATHRGR